MCSLNINCANGGTPSPECTACICPAGYTGDDCAMEIDDCSPNPCQNGGTCMVNSDDGFTCQCPISRNGSDCTMCASRYTMVASECGTYKLSLT